VSVDQPGQHRIARQVDTLGADGGGGDLRVRTDSRYAVTRDEDTLVGLRGVAHGVDESARAHEDAALLWRRGLRAERHGEGEQRDAESSRCHCEASGVEARVGNRGDGQQVPLSGR
jgi:hypothetical protein